MKWSLRDEELETVACDFCGSTEQVNPIRRPVGLDVGECRNCGLAYVNPRPTRTGMMRHYQSSYVADTAEARWRVYRLTDLPSSHVRRIARHANLQGAAVLDIGCGSGIFLDALRRAGAAQLVGIEPGSVASKSACRRLPSAMILEGTYEEASVNDDYFDLIVATNLLEHVYSPRRFFAFACRALKPNGCLYIQTPNWGAARKHGTDWRGLKADFEHIYYFDQSTLARYLRDYGCSPVDVDYEPFTGGDGDAGGQAVVGHQDRRLASHGKRALSFSPLVSRWFHRLVRRYRRYRNREAIRDGSAHILTMLSQKRRKEA